MKVRYLIVTALMFCMGALLFPMTAHAAEVDPPRVQTTIAGEVLRVEAQNGFYAVEAIFVNGTRFNFRVDSVLQVDLLAFDDEEIITVYAIDFAGNRSNTVTVNNPHYIGLNIASQPATPPQGIPVTPQQSNPFTPDGQASVLDNATNDDEKEFFTFQTPAGNVFFLIVDRQRGTDNVYFLNAVTEQDLIALAEQAGNQISGTGTDGIPVGTAPQIPDEQETDTADDADAAETTTAESGGNNGTIIFLIIAMAIAGGAGYYFKIVRPKQQAQDDDYADEDEEDLGEEMEFEDEVSETGEDGEYFDISDTGDSENSEDSEDETGDDK